MADAAAALSLGLALFFLSSATTPATSSATPRPLGARANNITLGSSLSTTAATPASTSSWLSPSARFAFGFYPVPGGFAVGVWLATSPNITVLWTAFRDEPPFTSATLTLLLDGQLHLTSTSGARRDKVISGTKHGSYASMLDTGELVIYDKEGRPVWSTSDSPTDTILAGQTLRPDQKLVSASNNNGSTGGFRLKMQTDGNLVLYPADTYGSSYYADSSYNAYWASGTFDAGTDVSLSLKLDSQGCLFLSPDLQSNYTRVNLTDAQPSRPSSSHGRVATAAEVYYRATLDVDGVLRLYSHTFFRGSSTSTAVVWWAPVDPCAVKGACGFNSYCDTSPGGGAPDCLCPPGFRFIDPGKSSAGCERNFTAVGCGGGGGSAATAARGVTMTAVSVAWAESLSSVSASARAEDCEAACLADCFCDAALFRDGKCVKQSLPLRYGHRSEDVETFLKDGGSAVDPRTTSIHPGDKTQTPPLI
uniref:G-type lectin S-receptor-like serine/threonine-protein kinase RLK1 n=1 Tax=Anthurium amnicola TaxID=1678845 RepID=A0A1D1ZG87_9ARAE